MVPSEAAPWEPPDLALAVGDRVVKLKAPECPWHQCDGGGLVGVIDRVEPPTAFFGHRYRVRVELDASVAWLHLARSELCRLAAPDPRAGGA